MRKYKLKPASTLGHFSIDYDRELNDEQRAVVMAGDGPVMVIAGAGSGKTRTVTYRVVRLLELGVDPSHILLVTFTNKAAREMLHRVELLVRSEINALWGGTFHHVGNLVLRRHANLLGYNNQYTILDREDSKDLLESCVGELGIDTKRERFPKGEVLQNIYSLSIDREVSFQDVIQEKYEYFIGLTDELCAVLRHYDEKKLKINAMDYDDLLLNWKRLLEENEAIRKVYSERFRYTLVDEYQDTNKLQSDIVDLLASHHKNVMIVGDDGQSIFSFRGANFENIINFPARYPDAQVFRLETNYRSTPEILALANSSINHNTKQFKKRLKAIRPPGAKPALVSLNDSGQQAEFVAQRILELRDEGIPLSQIAVLYRAHFHSMELQFELTRRNIPFVITSGLRFFEQRHIKDITAYMKVAVNPYDELAWKRVIRLLPRVGKSTANKIWNAISTSSDPFKAIESRIIESYVPKAGAAGWESFVATLKKLQSPELLKAPGEMLQVILQETYDAYMQAQFENYELRLEDIKQLSNFALQFEDVESFLSELALLGNVEAEDVLLDEVADEKVNLTTIHQAKGLEWTVVFLIWLTEGRFPSHRSLDGQEGEEEERRLFYVAVTRAKDQLYLSYPVMAQSGSYRYLIQKPSRFLREINPATYEPWAVE